MSNVSLLTRYPILNPSIRVYISILIRVFIIYLFLVIRILSRYLYLLSVLE